MGVCALSLFAARTIAALRRRHIGRILERALSIRPGARPRRRLGSCCLRPAGSSPRAGCLAISGRRDGNVCQCPRMRSPVPPERGGCRRVLRGGVAHAADADQRAVEDKRHSIDAAQVVFGTPALDDGDEVVSDAAALRAVEALHVQAHRSGDAIQHGIFITGDLLFDAPVLACPPDPRRGAGKVQIIVGFPGKAR